MYNFLICFFSAQQFDKTTAEMLATPPKGMLFKWTNAFKGWQSRWFSINQQEGVLHYYMVCVVWVCVYEGAVCMVIELF